MEKDPNQIIEKTPYYRQLRNVLWLVLVVHIVALGWYFHSVNSGEVETRVLQEAEIQTSDTRSFQ